MGAGNVLPVIPVFAAGAPSIADLQSLSYAASFVIDLDVRPAWHVFLYATQALAATTWTGVLFDHVAFDGDGVWTPATHNAIIVTQGYYRLEACVQVAAGAAKDNFVVAFEWIAGAASPYSSASPLFFGYKGSAMPQTGSAAGTASYCTSEITPFPMYPGDSLQVMAWSAAAHTIDFNRNTSFSQGRFSTQFTGYLCRTGT